MELNAEQLKRLVHGLIETHDHELTCGACFEQLDLFVELRLAGKRPGEALPLVEAHLRLCQDCREEYELLLDALRALD
jgi:predicted anti-sigma-YlaC factor YlaD